MNPYKVLEVPADASPEEIKKAFKKMASKHHPDKGGDQEKFKEINEAYQRLTEPEKFAHENRQGPGPGGFGGNPFGAFGFDFHSMFPIQVNISMTLEEAYNGKDFMFNVDGQKVTVPLPPGVDFTRAFGGQVNLSTGPRMLQANIQIVKHPIFNLDEHLNLICEKEISLIEYYEGGTIQVKDLEGKTYNVKVVPKKQNQVIKLSGKGYRINMPVGPGKMVEAKKDMFIHIKVRLPTLTDSQIEQLKTVVQN